MAINRGSLAEQPWLGNTLEQRELARGARAMQQRLEAMAEAATRVGHGNSGRDRGVVRVGRAGCEGGDQQWQSRDGRRLVRAVGDGRRSVAAAAGGRARRCCAQGRRRTEEEGDAQEGGWRKKKKKEKKEKKGKEKEIKERKIKENKRKFLKIVEK